jgi:hypothetical protein
MPTYTYFCTANNKTVEVSHTIKAKLETWGEVCYVGQISLDDTDPMASVERVIKSPPGVAVATFNSELKNHGFTKLVKRDTGVYENVTAINGEKRYMNAGDKDSIPHLNKKISD